MNKHVSILVFSAMMVGLAGCASDLTEDESQGDSQSALEGSAKSGPADTNTPSANPDTGNKTGGDTGNKTGGDTGAKTGGDTGAKTGGDTGSGSNGS